MATYSAMNDGYGAAAFEVENAFAWCDGIEVHVNPERLKVVVLSVLSSRSLRGEWFGPDAVAVGAAVCNGHMPPAILADFCDENTPTTADRGLRAGELLRRAV